MDRVILGKTGLEVNKNGFGALPVQRVSKKDAVYLLQKAFYNGINYFDLAAGDAACFPYYGKAFENVRDKVIYQIHFGANYETGNYGWTTNLEKVKKSIAWQ